MYVPLLDHRGQPWEGLRQMALAAGADEYYHRGAAAVVAQHPAIADSIRDAIRSVDQAVCMERRSRGAARRAIDPADLNARLRESLDETEPAWVFEAAVVRGGVVLPNEADTTIRSGFDAALCDMHANVARLWNFCFGEVHLHEGSRYWQRTSFRHPVLQRAYDELRTHHPEPAAGKDWYVPARMPTVLVEIEFGNSARQERDLFKALQASSLLDVDLFVLVSMSPNGDANRWISNGTVHHGSVVRQLATYPQAVPIPTWALGIEVLEVGPLHRTLTAAERERHRRNARNPA